MAGTHGRSTPDVIDELLETGPAFSFYQILRLLKLLFKQGEDAPLPLSLPVSRIKIKPNLSLSFPASGVESVTANEKGGFTIRANLLSLYGTCSPLPTFYTEELMNDESMGNESVRDLLDVINHRLYELLFGAWSRNRSMLKIWEENDASRLNRFFCLIGMERKNLVRDMGQPERLLRYAGLFAMNTRSAKGLESLLSDAFGNLPVSIVQLIERKARIPEDQVCCLGKNITLGMSSNLGNEVTHKTGAFRIVIGPVSDSLYRRFIPGEEDYTLLTTLTRLYLNQPLDYDVELIMDKSEKPKTVCLGFETFSRLGLDTWVFSDQGPDEFRTRFYPGKEAA